MVDIKQKNLFNYVFKRALEESIKHSNEYKDIYDSIDKELDEYTETRYIVYNAIDKVELNDYREYGDTIIVGLTVYHRPIDLSKKLQDYNEITSTINLITLVLLSDFEMNAKKYLGKSLNGKLTLYMVRELIEV